MLGQLFSQKPDYENVTPSKAAKVIQQNMKLFTVMQHDFSNSSS
jgi:hypothetical protein